jgi:hypothetical protein
VRPQKEQILCSLGEVLLIHCVVCIIYAPQTHQPSF